MVTTEISGRGTDEAQWRGWLDRAQFPALRGPREGQRIVVVAAHPDDEILGVGGLLKQLAPLHPAVLVWATDGEGSHPGSTALRPDQLAAIRREESRRALVRLGVAPRAIRHLGLPDSKLAKHHTVLRAELRALIQPEDYVLSTWHDDGHPDHEVVGELCADIATECVQFPIWLWHWSAPADPRVPWSKARRISSIDQIGKASAIAEFVSQTEAVGSAAADAAILPPHVVQHFTRPDEIVFLP